MKSPDIIIHQNISMYNQKRNKLVSTKTRLPPWMPGQIDLQNIFFKKTLCPRDILQPATAG